MGKVNYAAIDIGSNAVRLSERWEAICELKRLAGQRRKEKQKIKKYKY